LRNRETDQDKDFMKNFETQKFLLEATKKMCEEKRIELIIFRRHASSLQESVKKIKKILESKINQKK